MEAVTRGRVVGRNRKGKGTMSGKRSAFAQARESLLTAIMQSLSNDERFLAAWLLGRNGRHEQPWYRDVDIQVVVADTSSASFCTSVAPLGMRTAPARLALFEQFGTPAVIYEDHVDSPERGTAATVLYASAITVRWTLLPQSAAQRPSHSLLLFEKVLVPREPPYLPASLPQRLEEAAVQLAFFWVMVPIIIKYIIRHDPVFFDLHLPLEEAERLLAGAAPSARSGWGIELYQTREERIDYLLSLCQRAQGLSARILKLGGQVPEATLPIIDLWLEMLTNPPRRKQYAADREDLLARIVSTLQADERCVAAWLEGSYAQGTKDDLSDLDLRVVLADTANVLCEVPWPSASFRTTPERYRFLSQFGEPLIAWETRTFATIAEQGSFTLTYYKTIGVHVDWVLIPKGKAERPVQSMVLFDKVGMALKPEASPEDREHRLQRLSDQISFFWTLAAESWQYLATHDLAYYHLTLERLQNILGHMRADLDGTPRTYTHTPLYRTQEEQIMAQRHLCDEMEQFMRVVAQMGGDVLPSPSAIIEKRLALLTEEPEVIR
jgi:Streptomycin adenylyltransferase